METQEKLQIQDPEDPRYHYLFKTNLTHLSVRIVY